MNGRRLFLGLAALLVGSVSAVDSDGKTSSSAYKFSSVAITVSNQSPYSRNNQQVPGFPNLHGSGRVSNKSFGTASGSPID